MPLYFLLCEFQYLFVTQVSPFCFSPLEVGEIREGQSPIPSPTSVWIICSRRGCGQKAQPPPYCVQGFNNQTQHTQSLLWTVCSPKPLGKD